VCDPGVLAATELCGPIRPVQGPVDPYERMVLRGVGIVVDDSDPIMAIIYDTSLDHVGTGMPALTGKIATAVGRARMAREAAEQEDSRLTALAERINNELKPA
jgi:hypothetical protein